MTTNLRETDLLDSLPNAAAGRSPSAKTPIYDQLVAELATDGVTGASDAVPAGPEPPGASGP